MPNHKHDRTKRSARVKENHASYHLSVLTKWKNKCIYLISVFKESFSKALFRRHSGKAIRMIQSMESILFEDKFKR